MKKSLSLCQAILLSACLTVFTLTPKCLNAQAAQFIKQARPLEHPRAFHGTAVLGDFLYVIGGSTLRPDSTGEQIQNVDSSVYSSRITIGSQPGVWTLSDWEENTSLPEPLHYIGNSTLVLNDVVYVVGGSDNPVGGKLSNVAYWSKPLADGTLTPWQKSRPFGSGLSTLTAVSTPGHIHIIGGIARNTGSEGPPTLVSDSVYSNQIFSDGTMGQWSDAPKIPIPLWFHCAGVAANKVYIWGGLAGTVPSVENTSPMVFSSQVLGNGKLGPWLRDPVALQVGVYSGVAAVAGPYLLAFSNRYARTAPGEVAPVSGDVWWTYITPRGMYPWTREETPIPNRLYHSVAADYRRGTIWITGGRPGRGIEMIDTIAYFSLSNEARQLAENQWVTSQQNHSNTVSTFETLVSQGSGGDQSEDQLSFLADRRLSDDAVAGFQTIGQARRESGKAGQEKPLVMYFNIESAKPCIDQKQVLESGNMASLTSQASMAWINTREYPQLAQQMGVYRIPTWVFFDKSGNEVQRAPQVMQFSELESMIGSLQ